MTDAAEARKEDGNALFRAGKYAEALTAYADAFEGAKRAGSTELMVTCLCNQAAVALKTHAYPRCVDDCTAALALQPDATKALYRRAQAHKATKDLAGAYKDLALLIKLQPANAEAVALMRQVREAFGSASSASGGTTEVGLVLAAAVKAAGSSGGGDADVLADGLRSLISLCAEERLHAMDFARRAGHQFVAGLLLRRLQPGGGAPGPVTDLCVQLLAACCAHAPFVAAHVRASGAARWASARPTDAVLPDLVEHLCEGSGDAVQLSFEGLALLCGVLLSPARCPDPGASSSSSGSSCGSGGSSLHVTVVALLMRVLKALPLGRDGAVLDKAAPAPQPYLAEVSARCFLRALFAAVDNLSGTGDSGGSSGGSSSSSSSSSSSGGSRSGGSSSSGGALPQGSLETFSLLADALAAFVSESSDYFGAGDAIAEAKLDHRTGVPLSRPLSGSI